jgi:hypothetical protein
MSGGTVVTIALSAIIVFLGVVAAIISEARMPGSTAAASRAVELQSAMRPPPGGGPVETEFALEVSQPGI